MGNSRMYESCKLCVSTGWPGAPVMAEPNLMDVCTFSLALA